MTEPNDPRLGRRPMADPRHGYSPGPWISLTVGAVVLALVVWGLVGWVGGVK